MLPITAGRTIKGLHITQINGHTEHAHGRHRFGVGYRSRLKSDVLSTGPALYSSQETTWFGASIISEDKQELLVRLLEG